MPWLLKINWGSHPKTLERAQEYSKKYELHRKTENWFQANEVYIRLDNLMSQYRLFRLLRASTEILYEAKELTSYRPAFGKRDDCKMTKEYLDILSQIADYEEYLEHPEDYGGEEHLIFEDIDGTKSVTSIPKPEPPPPPPKKTRALLVFPGNMRDKWMFYKQYCSMYETVLLDVDSLQYTIKNFIKFCLSQLETLNANTYAFRF